MEYTYKFWNWNRCAVMADDKKVPLYGKRRVLPHLVFCIRYLNYDLWNISFIFGTRCIGFNS